MPARRAPNLGVVDLSAVIFVVLALAWALYLIPTALRHHDEIARTRSIDRFSNAMRVLARREAVNRRDTRLVVTPPRPQPRMVLPQPSAATVAAVAAVAASAAVEVSREGAGPRTPPAARAAARAAAKRRRRILGLLVLSVLGVTGAAYLGYLPWWAVAIPGGLVVAYLVLCRVLVRRDQRTRSRIAADASPPARRPAARVQAPYGAMHPMITPAASADGAPSGDRDDEADLDEDTVGLSAAALGAAMSAETVEEADEAAAAAVAVARAESGSLWDPLPMTLPTYVTMPRATRTVRTIDLSEPGSWSSGRSEADSRLVEEAAASRESSSEGPQEQRAVGS